MEGHFNEKIRYGISENVVPTRGLNTKTEFTAERCANIIYLTLRTAKSFRGSRLRRRGHGNSRGQAKKRSIKKKISL